MTSPSIWSPPSWSLLVPPVLLTIQSTLCQCEQTQGLRLFHLSLLPVCLYATWVCCDTLFEPARQFVLFNIIIQITKMWTCFRSIELATARDQYVWIGYPAAYQSEASKARDKTLGGNPKVVRAMLDGISNLCSLRGVGWSWGIKGKQIPAPHDSASFLSSLLFILAWTQALTVAGVSTVVAIRRNGSYADGSSSLFSVNPSTTITVVERLLLVLAVGVATFASLDMGYAGLTLVVWLFTGLLRAVLPQSLAPRPFDSRAWPSLMRNPIRSTSLHEFWGVRWHSLFRRIFVHDGATPASGVMQRLGSGRGAQTAAGGFGAFIISGLMHESFNAATPWLPRDPQHDTFKFFAIQPFGIIVESAFTKTTGKRVSGPLGYIWTFTFLLLTGRLMADCWVKRGIVDFMPLPSEWEWWRWTIPFGIMFPPSLKG